MKQHALLTFAVAVLMCVVPTFAQQPQQRLAAPAPTPSPAPAPPGEKPTDILTDRPDVDPDESMDLLGQPFESKSQGLSLRPPKDSKAVRRLGAQEIVEFVNEPKNWTLKISKLELPEPGSLTEWRDAQGRPQPGVLESTAKRLKDENPDAQFLRQEKITLADGDVGLISLRYTNALKSHLSQQAIVQRTDQLYFVVSFTTPGAEKGAKEADALATERLAVETFRQLLDSVKLLNRDDVRRDQDERLFRSRAQLLNFTAKRLQETIRPQQWSRILKNGKDIGYTYLEERTDVKGGQDGLEVRVRSRVLPGKEMQIDIGSILYSSMDLRHEDWSTLTQTSNTKQLAAQNAVKPPSFTEFGLSDRRAIPGRGDDYKMNVQFLAAGGAEGFEPIERSLPPWYLPQAISHLLPRLLPLDPRTYMFAVWSPDLREVMNRYVDVEGPKVYTFNGERIRAYAMKDRMGLEGSVTTHYLSSDRVWMGSENKDGGIIVMPSNEETLLSIWKEADLTRPEAPKKPQAAADEAAAPANPAAKQRNTGPAAPAKPAQPKRRGLDGSAK